MSELPKTDPLALRPKVRIEIVEDRSEGSRADQGFIRVRRLILRNVYEDGTQSRDYVYDCAERDAMDAVGIMLYTRQSGETLVCLRSSIRPPLALRPGYALPIQSGSADPTLFEIPAGLVEKDEHGVEGLKGCAARETMEEVGLPVDASAFELLGPATCLTPGLIAEKLHYLTAEVDPSKTEAPTMDGSPVEERARVVWVTLEAALDACRDGRIEDVKTEIALRRLAERLQKLDTPRS